MIKKFVTAALIFSGASAPAFSQGLSGAFLAGRHASITNEFSRSSEYNTRVLGFDRENLLALENVILSNIALGRVDMAVPVARAYAEKETDSQIANLVVLTDMIQNAQFEKIAKAVGTTLDVNTLVNNLLLAWSAAGVGDVDRSVILFDDFLKDAQLTEFTQYHKAMMFVSLGDYDRAMPLLETIDVRFRGIGGRAMLARLKILVSQGAKDRALELFDAVYGPSTDPELQNIRAQLDAGDLKVVKLPATVSQGMAEIFLSIAAFVTNDSEPVFSLMYARLAQALIGDDTDAIFLSAQMLDELGQYDLAVREYNKILPDHPKFYAAELGRFDAMVATGNRDGAIEAMEQLVRLHPDVPLGYAALGDTLRRAERNAEAKDAYDRAIALYENQNAASWRIYYARGIVHSNLDDWPNTEADFRKALEIKPDQPQVLNYLGYSMVEKNINLDEALAMIQTAVDQSPDSGYIIDSLGWAKFRLRQFAESVPHLERAAELMPVDPIVNDHLGDAYWAVGRKLEAEFQWRRALSFDPEAKEIDRIRRKLDVGLDQVLIEENQDPTTQTVQK